MFYWPDNPVACGTYSKSRIPLNILKMHIYISYSELMLLTLCVFWFCPFFFLGKFFEYIQLKLEDDCCLQTGASFKFSLLLESVWMPSVCVPAFRFFHGKYYKQKVKKIRYTLILITVKVL